MLDLTINKVGLEHNIERARQQNIILPTIEQQMDPTKIPEKILAKLDGVGLWDVNPINLFRITWKNEQKEVGGKFGGPNYIVIPPELSGVPCRIICMIGKWFPTGCHKVGASYGCLAPELTTGQFDSTYHKAVWPSTGNYCRGGAFDSALLGCYSIAILPEGMSKERFEWLKGIASEVIATPGTESNVKEIFDKTHELRATREDVWILNQFEQWGNYMWHYNVTGSAITEAYEDMKQEGDRFFGAAFTSGSAGTSAAGDWLKEKYPGFKLAVGEALQCPTILNNGFGAHRIEGIGDKHVPWIHNIKACDMVIDIDDEDSQKVLRLFNEPDGRAYLKEIGVDAELVDQLGYFGISGIANLLCCIKMAKYYELTEHDVLATVMTDSAEMYTSRVKELQDEDGPYSHEMAAVDYNKHILDEKIDNMRELTYYDRKTIHNLKYYTWVEQQGKTVDEINALWYDEANTWAALRKERAKVDELINEFNERTGLLKAL